MQGKLLSRLTGSNSSMVILGLVLGERIDFPGLALARSRPESEAPCCHEEEC